MKPSDFVRELKERPPAPVYLMLGAEAYRRRVCRHALIKRVLSEEERDSGLTLYDLDQTPLPDVIDDARSLSLFAPNRLIWASSAEALLPRGRAAASDHPGLAALQDYVRDPSPMVVLVLESSRFELEGEDKKKADRVRKLYSAIPERQVVEFPPYSPSESQRLAQELARRAHLSIGPGELTLLVDAVGGDATRIATEIEKLQLFVGEGGKVSAEDIQRMVPSAKATTIFELVGALGRGDRRTALELLDVLVQEGEYLPLALSFLETQFRQALVAREMRLRNPKQIEAHFRSTGARIWFRKAQEIHQTATFFTPLQLKKAVAAIHAADRDLRDARPDDRTVMERFVLSLGDSSSP